MVKSSSEISVLNFPAVKVYVFNYYFRPSSGIASYVRTNGTVTCYLHLTRPCCVALGQVLIWVVSPDCVEEHFFFFMLTLGIT